jgi:hypothetical protein
VNSLRAVNGFSALRDEMTKRGLDWAGGSAALATLREAASAKTDESGSVPEVLRVYRDMADALTDRMVGPANGRAGIVLGRAHQNLVHKKRDIIHIGVEPCGRTSRLTIA